MLSNIGMNAVLDDGRRGIIRYIGPTKFKEGVWVGVELEEPLGRNDGQVQGVRYFECKPSHGLFVHPSKVTLESGGPNIGEILLFTPVKKPLLFPSFKREAPHQHANSYRNEYPMKAKNDQQQTDHSLLAMENLGKKLALRDQELKSLGLKLENALSVQGKYADLTTKARQRCKKVYMTMSELKRAFLDLQTAKEATECFYETELSKVKNLLKMKNNLGLIEAGIETHRFIDVEENIEIQNKKIYENWLLKARKARSEHSNTDVKRLLDTFSSNVTRLGGTSVKKLEIISTSLNTMVQIYSELKTSLIKSSS